MTSLASGSRLFRGMTGLLGRKFGPAATVLVCANGDLSSGRMGGILRKRRFVLPGSTGISVREKGGFVGLYGTTGVSISFVAGHCFVGNFGDRTVSVDRRRTFGTLSGLGCGGCGRSG